MYSEHKEIRVSSIYIYYTISVVYILRERGQSYSFFFSCVLQERKERKENKKGTKGVERICVF